MSKNVAFKDNRGAPVFIHSELDDYGLEMSEFRIYCHIARRAGNSSAWPGIDSISKICRMHKQTAISAIKKLEFYRMIEVVREQGSCNVYVLTKKTQWKHHQSNIDNGGGSLKEITGESKIDNGVVRKEITGESKIDNERYSSKVLHLSSSTEGSPWLPKFVDPFGNEIVESFRTIPFLEALKEWHKYKKERRQGYKPIGAKGCLSKLTTQFSSPQEAIQAIKHSISSNYAGIFPPSKLIGTNPPVPPPPRNADRNQLQEKISCKSL